MDDLAYLAALSETPEEPAEEFPYSSDYDLSKATSHFAAVLQGIEDISDLERRRLWEAHLKELDEERKSMANVVMDCLEDDKVSFSLATGQTRSVSLTPVAEYKEPRVRTFVAKNSKIHKRKTGTENPGQGRIAQAKSIPDRVRVLYELFQLHMSQPNKPLYDYTASYRLYYSTLIRTVGTCILHCYKGDVDAFTAMFVASGRKLVRKSPYRCSKCDHITKKKPGKNAKTVATDGVSTQAATEASTGTT